MIKDYETFLEFTKECYKNQRMETVKDVARRWTKNEEKQNEVRALSQQGSTTDGTGFVKKI